MGWAISDLAENLFSIQPKARLTWGLKSRTSPAGGSHSGFPLSYRGSLISQPEFQLLKILVFCDAQTSWPEKRFVYVYFVPVQSNMRQLDSSQEILADARCWRRIVSHRMEEFEKLEFWSQTDLPIILLSYFGVYDLEQGLYAPQTSLLSLVECG